MVYTLTMDASHKVKQGSHCSRFMRHIARDADQKAGFNFGHTNENIDSARTRLNVTFVNDGDDWFRELKSVGSQPPSQELMNYLESRLNTVNRKLRSDAVIMRPLILQLDPKWFEDKCPNWKEEGLNSVARHFTESMVDWACEKFGHKNIVGFSLHNDETSPQVQLLMTPVTDDGRLSQKHFFPNPQSLREMHRDFREWMEDCGYDVGFEVSERSRQHLSSREYAMMADRLKAGIEDVEYNKEVASKMLKVASKDRDRVEKDKAALEKLKTRVEDRENELLDREVRLRRREEDVGVREFEMRESEKDLKVREALLRENETLIQHRQQALRHRAQELEEAMDRVRDSENIAIKAAEDFKSEMEMLDNESKKVAEFHRKFRSFLEKKGIGTELIDRVQRSCNGYMGTNTVRRQFYQDKYPDFYTPKPSKSSDDFEMGF